MSAPARRTGVHRTLAYGAHPDQVGDLLTPAGDPPATGWPVAVLLHGGFWRERYRRSLMAALAADLVGLGVAVWNLEYRRVGGAGGWPQTFVDVAVGIDHLTRLTAPPAVADALRSSPRPRLDLEAVTVIGHSAGGHLALWAAGRGRLPAGAPGAGPVVRPARVVALAPVADLRAADAAGLSDGAVRELLGGGPDEQPRRWGCADPVMLVGHGTPVLLVHGEHDDDVPPAQSVRYRDAAQQVGDPAVLLTGSWDHLGLIDPASPGWRAARVSITRPADVPGPPVTEPGARRGSP